MRAYLPVPHSWYIGLLALNFGAAGEYSKFCWEQGSLLDREVLITSNIGEDNSIANANLGTHTIYRDSCALPDPVSSSCNVYGREVKA